jgi:hypothetical protein
MGQEGTLWFMLCNLNPNPMAEINAIDSKKITSFSLASTWAFPT